MNFSISSPPPPPGRLLGVGCAKQGESIKGFTYTFAPLTLIGHPPTPPSGYAAFLGGGSATEPCVRGTNPSPCDRTPQWMDVVSTFNPTTDDILKLIDMSVLPRMDICRGLWPSEGPVRMLQDIVGALQLDAATMLGFVDPEAVAPEHVFRHFGLFPDAIVRTLRALHQTVSVRPRPLCPCLSVPLSSAPVPAASPAHYLYLCRQLYRRRLPSGRP